MSVVGDQSLRRRWQGPKQAGFGGWLQTEGCQAGWTSVETQQSAATVPTTGDRRVRCWALSWTAATGDARKPFLELAYNFFVIFLTQGAESVGGGDTTELVDS